jgi:AbrB family looped-hinge helix DNA binding protein
LAGKTYLTVMNAITRMSSKGQVVIPKDVRDALGWTEGQELRVIKSGGRAMIELATPKKEKISWEDFERSVPKYEGPPVSIDEINQTLDDMRRERGLKRG